MTWVFIFFCMSDFCSILHQLIRDRLEMANFGVITALTSIFLSVLLTFVPAQGGNGLDFLNCCSNNHNVYFKLGGTFVSNIFVTKVTAQWASVQRWRRRSGSSYTVPAGTEDSLFGNGVILRVTITWAQTG